MQFEWDPLKAAANLRTHRVTFAEAVTVFEVVVYTYPGPEIIRVISAWKANKRQRVLYEKGRR